ncbi:sulfotransferase [Gracilibacillus sp. JCM 18860]|uniref:sulfotransferase n=1 Tax=Gracilibacillus sp. JCM 18860 TaxID=1306159 RepID=UPI0006CF63AA
MDFKQIISIHGVPRSGTTWLGQILDSSPQVKYKYQPLFSYTFKNKINLQSTQTDILNFYQQLYNKSDEFLDQIKQKETGIHPTFKDKTNSPLWLVTKMVRYHYLVPHLLKNIENIKFVFIVRNPCGSLKSWKNAPREFKKDLWDFNEQWEFGQCRNEFRPEEYFGYHKWKEAAKLFLDMKDKYPERVFLLKYEDLVKDPLGKSMELYKFCDLDFSDQTKEFIKDSTNIKQEDVYSVYKGPKDVNDWKNELDESIVNKIYNDLKDTELGIFL